MRIARELTVTWGRYMRSEVIPSSEADQGFTKTLKSSGVKLHLQPQCSLWGIHLEDYRRNGCCLFRLFSVSSCDRSGEPVLTFCHQSVRADLGESCLCSEPNKGIKTFSENKTFSPPSLFRTKALRCRLKLQTESE